jgi:UDP-glucose 4-epimerase
VFCAGGASPAESDLDPLGDLYATVPPLLGVLEAVRRREHGRILAVSSGGAVYGEPTSLPVREDHALVPRSSYGILKVTCEHYLALYAAQWGVHSTALRCANVYGPGQRAFRSQGIVASLLGCAATGRRFTIFGDGATVRDYVYIDDVVDAVRQLLTVEALPPALNIATGVGTSVRELVDLVEQLTGTTLRVQHEPARPADLQRIVLSTDLLRDVISYDPVDLETGIEQTVAATTELVSAIE